MRSNTQPSLQETAHDVPTLHHNLFFGFFPAFYYKLLLFHRYIVLQGRKRKSLHALTTFFLVVSDTSYNLHKNLMIV